MKQCNNCANRPCREIRSTYPNSEPKSPEDTGMRDTHFLSVEQMQGDCGSAVEHLPWGVPIIEQLMDKNGSDAQEKLMLLFRLQIVKKKRGQGYYINRV
jgi:hypothetical protein